MMRIRREFRLLLGFLTLWSAPSFAGSENRDTDWFKEAKYGVLMHFLPGDAKGLELTNAFDVSALARQLEDVGAKYFVITLGQNSGYFISPNATYDKLAGYAAGERCSKRDLPLDLYQALKPKGIRLMLYLPCQTPNQDRQAQRAFGLRQGPQDQPIDVEFAKKWATVIQEWSDRYGEKVAGWWFDGGYQHIRFNEDIAGVYAAAVKHGNPHAIITFNPGVKVIRWTKAEDYTAGELNEPFDHVPVSRWLEGSQWHALTYLGAAWARRNTRYPAEKWAQWVRDVTARGGVVTLDMGPNWNPQAGPIGALAEAQVHQVKAIREAIVRSPSESLERYRADLAAFRKEYGGTRNLPDVPFFQFGMGLRTKYLFRSNALLNARSGKEIVHWDAKQVLIVPPEYLVSMTTSDGRTVTLREDEEAVWIEEDGQRRALEETRKPIHLPHFTEHRYASILRVLHHEILINVTDAGPLPNFYVYKKPWYRDGAMMALCLKATGNLDVIRDWIMGLSEPFDRNNAGETEADNLGQALFLISLVSDRNHPLVPKIQKELVRFEARDQASRYIKGRSDFAEHPVYQTKWAKYGLRALGLADPYTIPHRADSYSSLFWMDWRDSHVQGSEATDRGRYPYLGWATDHFQKIKLSPISNRDYPLTWEIEASQADYRGMSIVDSSFVQQKTCAPHTWHAAEVFLYLVDHTLQAQLPGNRIDLHQGWRLNSSAVAREDPADISSAGFDPKGWYAVSVPTTVLNALTKQGVYPDMRVGMNAYRIPDSSDEFNKQHDLARFSHLPDKRNLWRDPWWFRKSFVVPSLPADRRVWLHLDCINYRAEVWLNGKQFADSKNMVGMFQRFDLDITSAARTGENALTVKIFPVDHPGVPDRQLEPLGRDRGYQKDIMKDVTMVMTSGYDCMPTVPDRNMGIIQDVWVDWTGPVVVRHPFVVTELPLPQTDRTTLRISAELSNVTNSAVKGALRGRIAGTDVTFEQPVELAANQSRQIAIDPKPILRNPKLWWPRSYGEQALYKVELNFDVDGKQSDQKTTTFGVRQVSSEMVERNGWHGRRVLINGQKIFCRGGYIQPEILLDWDTKRIETEMRYLTEANLNLIYFEDIPNPPDALLDACDRLGIMFGQCHYACSWPRPGTDHPQDVDLLMRCTADLIKRYRNHPSLVMYMAQNEDDTRREVYEPWRKLIVELDGTRWWIPSAYFPSDRKNVPEWFKPDLPTGMNDKGASYGWAEPEQYFNWVRQSRNWMFMMESGSASVPPMSSYMKFMPEMQAKDGRVHPDSVWAHHDGCHYMKPFDEAMTRLFGGAGNTAEYIWKAHLLTADQHRSMFEAVNHRMWDITSGLTQWKITACWPSVEWQVFDWYHKPMVSWYYIKKAGESLHVQLNLPDRMVSVINRQLTVQPNLEVRARVLDLTGKPLWEKVAKVNAPANTYAETFTIPQPPQATPVYFVKLELKDAAGRIISDNFYWLRAEGTKDLRALETLAPVELKSACTIEKNGAEQIARVTITNPGDQLAFFVQLALTKGPGGEEILPVLWADNYFSLLPGETKSVTARFAAADAGSATPTLEIGGWNVQSPFECTSLELSPALPSEGQSFSVSATLDNTFLDGGRITLYVDDKPLAHEFAWARGEHRAKVTFSAKLTAGQHTLRVGSRRVLVDVK